MNKKVIMNVKLYEINNVYLKYELIFKKNHLKYKV